MATKNAAILGEEMERCMQELNTLRAEGLEAELLGPRYSDGNRRGVAKSRDQMPPEMKVTGLSRRGQRQSADLDEMEEDDRWSSPEPPSKAKFTGNNGRNSQREDARPSAKSRSKQNAWDDDPKTTLQNWPSMDQIDELKRKAVEEIEGEEDDEEEEEEEEEEDTNMEPPPRGNMWDTVAKFFDVKIIQSPEHVRQLVFDAMSSGGSLVGKIDDKVLKIFHDLTEQVLSKALPVVRDLRKEPIKKNMRRYGLAMIIVNEYLKLAGLHAHVHRDMETFVDFYDRTSKGRVYATDGEKYLRFSKCCDSVASEDNTTHAMSVKMTLRSISVEIARKMMLMATHLVELIVVLGWYEGK